MYRSRLCTNPAPSGGGSVCSGDAADASLCDMQDCDVDGGWTPWTGWSICAGSCGSGSQARYRECTNPTPSGDGKGCVGAHAEATLCQLKDDCPVDGMWAEWAMWSECSTLACGLGMRQRTRTCTCPRRSSGGADCDGEPNEIQSCSTPGFCGPLLVDTCGGVINFEPNPPNTTVDSTITVTCAEGKRATPSTITCLPTGFWSHKILCYPRSP